MAATQRVSVGDRLRSVPRSLYIVLAVALVLRVAWSLFVQQEPTNFGDPFIYLASCARDRRRRRVPPVLDDAADRVPSDRLSRLARRRDLDRQVGRARTPRAVGHHAHAGGARNRVGRIAVRDLPPALRRARRAPCGRAHGVLPQPDLLLGAAVLRDAVRVRPAARGLDRGARRVEPGAVAPGGRAVRRDRRARAHSSGRSRCRCRSSSASPCCARARVGSISARVVAVAFGIAVLVLVPWTIRNSRALHAFVPVSTNLGDTLCLDHSPGAYGGFRELPVDCSPVFPGASGEAKRNSFNLHVAVALGRAPSRSRARAAPPSLLVRLPDRRRRRRRGGQQSPRRRPRAAVGPGAARRAGRRLLLRRRDPRAHRDSPAVARRAATVRRDRRRVTRRGAVLPLRPRALPRARCCRSWRSARP